MARMETLKVGQEPRQTPSYAGPCWRDENNPGGKAFILVDSTLDVVQEPLSVASRPCSRAAADRPGK